MSLERIAEILGVDEVMINHGPRGVAIHVRAGQAWNSTTIDNSELIKSRGAGDERSGQQRRLESIAKHLAHIADANGRALERRAAQISGATRAALQADGYAEARRRWVSADTLSVQQQLTKAEPEIPTSISNYAVPDGPAAEAMPSRFHAIMAELRCL